MDIPAIQNLTQDIATNRVGRAVTLGPKRYVFVCLGCALLETSERSDKMTCSAACRVWAHRNGQLQRFRTLARTRHIPPALMPQCQAVKILRPDLATGILAGRIDIEDIRAEIYQAFIQRVFEAVEAEAQLDTPEVRS